MFLQLSLPINLSLSPEYTYAYIITFCSTREQSEATVPTPNADEFATNQTGNSKSFLLQAMLPRKQAMAIWRH